MFIEIHFWDETPKAWSQRIVYPWVFSRIWDKQMYFCKSIILMQWGLFFWTCNTLIVSVGSKQGWQDSEWWAQMVMLRIDEQILVDILVEVYIFGIISQDWGVALKDLGIIGDSVHRNSLLRWDTKGMEPTHMSDNWNLVQADGRIWIDDFLVEDWFWRYYWILIGGMNFGGWLLDGILILLGWDT